MPSYLLSHLSDPVLVRDFGTLLGRERGVTAEVLAHLAEIDERRLYLPAAHPSMLSYLVQQWRLSGATKSARHIPANVKRAVWERDQGQCTFTSEAGRRCAARTRLEFDHIVEVARGGEATVAGIRLRCRAHNQYAAECTFGTGFMREKREAAQRKADTRRQEREARSRAQAAAAEEVIAPLRALGFSG